MLLVREDIPIKLLSVENLPTEYFYSELNLHKKAGYLLFLYSTKEYNISDHLAVLPRCIDLYTSNYDNFLALGDFNEEIENTEMTEMK